MEYAIYNALRAGFDRIVLIIKPSMLEDVRNRRLTEVDWITGAIVREAARAGIPAPYHETLYRLVKAHESSWQRRPAH